MARLLISRQDYRQHASWFHGSSALSRTSSSQSGEVIFGTTVRAQQPGLGPIEPPSRPRIDLGLATQGSGTAFGSWPKRLLLHNFISSTSIDELTLLIDARTSSEARRFNNSSFLTRSDSTAKLRQAANVSQCHVRLPSKTKVEP
jgi:hypothetical protein